MFIFGNIIYFYKNYCTFQNNTIIERKMILFYIFAKLRNGWLSRRWLYFYICLWIKSVRMCCFGWSTWVKSGFTNIQWKKEGYFNSVLDNCGCSSLALTPKLNECYFLKGWLQCGIWDCINESLVCRYIKIRHCI